MAKIVSHPHVCLIDIITPPAMLLRLQYINVNMSQLQAFWE